MATGSLNLFVSKEKFLDKIADVELKINELDNIIQEYKNKRNTLDMFVGSEDAAYDLWLERIDQNVTECGKAKAALIESKRGLEDIVQKMEGMADKTRDTVQSAIDATSSTVQAAIKIAPLL